jgi:hypothetical protein
MNTVNLLSEVSRMCGLQAQMLYAEGKVAEARALAVRALALLLMVENEPKAKRIPIRVSQR